MAIARRAKDLLTAVDLNARQKSTWRKLSGGEKQRLSLALALAAKPKIAFLDEPTSGVDIFGRDLIRGIVRQLAEDGCAVILATHELDEAQRVADHVLMFEHGTLIANASLSELRDSHGGASQSLEDIFRSLSEQISTIETTLNMFGSQLRQELTVMARNGEQLLLLIGHTCLVACVFFTNQCLADRRSGKY